MGERKVVILMLEFAIEGFVFKKSTTTCMFHTYLTVAGMERYFTDLNKESRKWHNVLLSFT